MLGFRLRIAVLVTFFAAMPAIAASTASSEMDAVMKRQAETVEKNQQKLDQSIRKNEDDRRRTMEEAQKRVERDAARRSRP